MTGLVTDRDLALCAWLGRFPFLTVDLLHRWVRDIRHEGRSVSIVYTRLRVLEAAGLVDTAAVLAGVGKAVWLTGEGLRAIEAEGRPTPPRVGTFEHDLWVAELATWITIHRPTHELVTEREMRAIDTADGGESRELRYASKRPSAHARDGFIRVFPDLISRTSSGSQIIHEVERTPKELDRLLNLMTAHLQRTDTAAVRYYAPLAFLHRVERAAEKAREIGLQRDTTVQLFCVPWEEVQL